MADVKPAKPRKKLKDWALFCLRWGIAVVGIYVVVSHLTIRDQAWAILNQTTMRPQPVPLSRSVPEDSMTFPVVLPNGTNADLPREQIVNEPDAKTIDVFENGQVKKLQLVGLDFPGDINHTAKPSRVLVADNATAPARWLPVSAARNFTVKVPHPRDQVGLESMVKGARPALLWAALFVFPLTFVITSYRWNELLKALDIHISQRRTFVLNMVGGFYNTFMPGSTGGDVLKAYYASLQTPNRTRAVMSVLVDRVVGLLALILLGGVMASLQWSVPACRKVALGSGVIWACVLIGMALFYNPTLHKLSGLDWFLKKLPMQKQVRGAVDAMHQYGKRPLLGVWSLLISLPVHGAVVMSAMFAGMAFGLPLHWAYYWVAVPVIVLSGAIPISPQGAGVMEAFAVLLTRSQGVTVSQAFALTMSIRIVQVLWNLSGGIFVLRGGYHAPGAEEKKQLDPSDQLPNGPGGAPAVAV